MLEEDFRWPLWRAVLDHANPKATRQALQNLARYANPSMVEGHGLGMGRDAYERQGSSHSFIDMAWSLAEGLDSRGGLWTVEPFHPTAGDRQLVRTTAELLDGAGTCLDFAVTLAAMCVREQIGCHLAVSVRPSDGFNHAFVIVQEPTTAQAMAPDTIGAPFAKWAALMTGPYSSSTQIIDITPARGDDRAQRSSLNVRAEWLQKMLETSDGWVFAVDVMASLRHSGHDYYHLPTTTRDLGIVASLPDLPSDHVPLTTHEETRRALQSASGIKVLWGESGTGKSTLALERAIARGGKGWFLDGTDATTLQSSLADAEARSKGLLVGDSSDGDYRKSSAAAALRRLSATTRPWVVVIDNAEGEPSKLWDFIPTPKEQQLVIITTTRNDWDSLVSPQDIHKVTKIMGLDLVVDGTNWQASDIEWLPGLLRIAVGRGLSLDTVRSLEGQLEERLVRGALDVNGTGRIDWITKEARAVLAASFMPAERITVQWIAQSTGMSIDEAQAAIDALSLWGLVEPSRQSHDPRESREGRYVWMHRKVHAAVRSLRPESDVSMGWAVLSVYRQRAAHVHYTDDELEHLRTFLLEHRPDGALDVYAEAVEVVLDLLEPRGSARVKQAEQLAGALIDSIDASASRRQAEVKCVMLVAQARAVNQAPNRELTPELVHKAIDWCETAESLILGQSLDDVLLRGRATAMRGLLFKKLAAVGAMSDDEAIALLDASLEILRASFESRRDALVADAKGRGGEIMDPGQHIDRGIYNLGGANLALANRVRYSRPERIPQILSEGLAAYAESLALRRNLVHLPSDNTYLAASLWGVALMSLYGAYYCPGRLDLGIVNNVEELEGVRRNQTRVTLLRAAELAGGRALEMRVVVDGAEGGDTKKMRDLLRKILLAWEVIAETGEGKAADLVDALMPFLDDVDVSKRQMRDAFDA